MRVPVESLAPKPGGGDALPAAMRQQMEQSLGQDLSGVTVHTNSAAAQALGARAFTAGDSIHFAPGAYAPASPAGRELVAHELTHVVQQRAGTPPAAGSARGLLPAANGQTHGVTIQGVVAQRGAAPAGPVVSVNLTP